MLSSCGQICVHCLGKELRVFEVSSVTYTACLGRRMISNTQHAINTVGQHALATFAEGLHHYVSL